MDRKLWAGIPAGKWGDMSRKTEKISWKVLQEYTLNITTEEVVYIIMKVFKENMKWKSVFAF